MNTQYQDILEEIQRLETCLKPLPYEVSNEEHTKAKFRYFFDNFLYERIHDLSSFVEFSQLSSEKQTPARERDLEERANASKEELQKMFFSSLYDEYWESDETTNYAMIQLAQALSYGHYGECTGIPQVCERCLAERMYKLPSTQTWPTEEGATLYLKLAEAKEMKKKIELANSLENELKIDEVLEKNPKTKL